MRTPEAVAAVAADEGRAVLRARAVALRVADRGGRLHPLRPVRGDDERAGLLRRWGQQVLATAAGAPARRDVVGGPGSAVAGVHAGVDRLRAEDPALAADLAAAGIGAVAAVPLLGTSGTVGQLVVGFATTREADAQQRAEVATVADMVAAALERAVQAEAEHAVTVSLQQRVLRPLPAIPDLELDARYLPASRGVHVGGDWYDVLQVGWLTFLVVGDVVGHGQDAVSRVSELRALVAGLLHAGTPLERLLPTIERMQDRVDPTLASLLVVEVDPTGDARWVSAGHPPALARTGAGVALLDGAHGALLGVDLPGTVVGHARLGPGGLLVLCTDGLLERRGEALDEGLARVAAVLRDADDGAPLPALVDRLLALARHPDANPDDVVVLAARLGAP